MKLSALLVAAFAATAFSSPKDFHKPMVSEKVLPPLIKIDDLMKGARQLQTFVRFPSPFQSDCFSVLDSSG